MKDVDGFSCGGRVDVLEKRATRAIYDAVSRALEDPKKIFGDSRRAYEEGINTVEAMIRSLRRSTKNEIKENILKPYKQRNSFD